MTLSRQRSRANRLRHTIGFRVCDDFFGPEGAGSLFQRQATHSTTCRAVSHHYKLTFIGVLLALYVGSSVLAYFCAVFASPETFMVLFCPCLKLWCAISI
jgi:hypothetical protein